MDDQFLYRYFGADGTPLYNGISNDWTLRLRQHWRQDEWCGFVASVTVERHPDRVAVRAAEAASIRAEHPMYNVQHNRPGTVEADPITGTQWTAADVVLMAALGALAAYALYLAATAAIDRYREWKADRDEFRCWKQSRAGQAEPAAEDASITSNDDADIIKVVPETVTVIETEDPVAKSITTPTVLSGWVIPPARATPMASVPTSTAGALITLVAMLLAGASNVRCPTPPSDTQ